MATASANAGGFAIREQSAYGQGVSFAGVAAGGALSSMFWNPATMTQFEGKAFESNISLIIPNSSHSYTSSTLATALPGVYGSSTGNSGDLAVVPASYSSWQLNERFWLGLSVNAPFGLAVNFATTQAAAAYAQNASIFTMNFQPAVAYKISDMISVAVGMQVQYMKVNYTALASAGTAATAIIGGDGMAYGFTAGVTFTPMPSTVIGIGYRSALNQDIDGTLSLTGAVAGTTTGSVTTSINLPDTVTVGLRQRLGERFTLLAGFEWANWSRIGTSTVSTPSGATATIANTAVTLPFQYSDGYTYSLGGEYMWRPDLTLRAGIAFEKSPITDNVRTPRLPDNDRMWYSIGASYVPQGLHGFTFDLGYSFVDVKDTGINLGPGTGNPWSGASTYTGSVSSNIHILSVGLRYQWDKPRTMASR